MLDVVTRADAARQPAEDEAPHGRFPLPLLAGRASYVVWGALVMLLVSALELAFHLNHPSPYTHWDTITFLSDTYDIMYHGKLVDPIRVPGYPLFMLAVFAVAGHDNYTALYVAQQALFVLASLELFVLVALITRRASIAGVVALLFGLNAGPLSYANLLIAEGLSLFLFMTLALCVVLFIRTPSRRSLWLVAGAMLALAMTRPEFIYLPVPLFAYLGWLVWRRRSWRTYLPHFLAALLLVYGVVGLYIHQNAIQNQCGSITCVQNANLLGKVVQYHMTGADPKYAATDQLVSDFIAQGGWNIFDLYPTHPELSADYCKLSGAYATSVIERHPVQFVLDTIPLVFNPPIWWAINFIQDGHPFAGLLTAMQQIAVYIEGFLIYAPLFALVWVALLFWRPTSRTLLVEAMGAVALLVVFDRGMTVAGSFSDYIRLQSTSTPLATLLTLGSFLLLFPVLVQVRSSAESAQDATRPAAASPVTSPVNGTPFVSRLSRLWSWSVLTYRRATIKLRRVR